MALETANWRQYTVEQWERIIVKSMLVTSMFNKEDYPFVTCGFVTKTSDRNVIRIYSRRVGAIERPPFDFGDHRHANDYMVVAFACIGPGQYLGWTPLPPMIDTRMPPTAYTSAQMKSLKHVKNGQYAIKGYALMAYGRRDDSENQWHAWNDFTGLMKCTVGSAKVIKLKYRDWEPSLQMIEFSATTSDDGRNWLVKNISYADFDLCTKDRTWPKQSYFIDDLMLLPGDVQVSDDEFYFYSVKLQCKVVAYLKHVEQPDDMDKLQSTVFGAVVSTIWRDGGRTREYRAIAVAQTSVWNDRERYGRVASMLEPEFINENAVADDGLPLPVQRMPRMPEDVSCGPHHEDSEHETL